MDVLLLSHCSYHNLCDQSKSDLEASENRCAAISKECDLAQEKVNQLREANCNLEAQLSEERKKLVEVTRESVQRGLAAVKPWGTLCDMAAAVQECVEENGFSVVREFGGHGIGLDFHEDPFVGFTVESPDVDTLLVPGMCFTIEPMVNAGAPDIFIDEKNGWIVHTKDGSDSAQWEVQLVVTEDGYELLSW